MQFSSSQPDYAAGGWEAMLLISQADGQVSFSQPTKPEHMLLGSQLLATPGASQVIHILDLYYIINLTVCLNLCILYIYVSCFVGLYFFCLLCFLVTVAEISAENDTFLHHGQCRHLSVCLEKCL